MCFFSFQLPVFRICFQMPAWFEISRKNSMALSKMVATITKLIKISETHKLLNLQNLSAESQSRLSGAAKSQSRRNRGPRAVGVKLLSHWPWCRREVPASRLVQQGLLTADMLKQLKESGWRNKLSRASGRPETGTSLKGTRRKKKESRFRLVSFYFYK